MASIKIIFLVIYIVLVILAKYMFPELTVIEIETEGCGCTVCRKIHENFPMTEDSKILSVERIPIAILKNKRNKGREGNIKKTRVNCTGIEICVKYMRLNKVTTMAIIITVYNIFFSFN